MLPQRFALLSAGLMLLIGVTFLMSQPETPFPDKGIFDQANVNVDAEKAEDGIEQQARGPVHEAYANPSSETAPQAQPVVGQAPPDLIEELPPDQKPEGDNVQWLSGYWHYDEEGKDFLWVSGLWRQMPPGMDWIPGTWNAVNGGYQWSSGFWKGQQQAELAVLPPPPEPLNAAGPPAPNAESTYVPGTWVYRETKYVWRPSYWMPCRPGWVWVPARFVWSPAGYYFCDGYWDYTLRERGLLFCPVVIRRDFLRVGFVYRPRFVVHDNALLSCLFIDTRFGCYRFGDYYDDVYARRGYIAWSNYRVNRLYRDSLYDHYRFVHRTNPAWERNLVTLTTQRIRNEAPRPPINLNVQINLVKNKNFNNTHVNNVVLLAPITKVNTKVVPLVKLDAGRVKEQQQFARKLNEASVKRATVETSLVKAKSIPKVGDSAKPVALTVPTNKALPSKERLLTLPPPPTGVKAKVDPKVFNSVIKIDPTKDKVITKDKAIVGKDKVVEPKDKATPPKDKVVDPKDKVTPPKDKGVPKEKVVPKDKGGEPKEKVVPKDKGGEPKEKVVPKDKGGEPKEKVVPKDKVVEPKEKVVPKDKGVEPKEKVVPKDKGAPKDKVILGKDKVVEPKDKVPPKDKSKDKSLEQGFRLEKLDGPQRRDVIWSSGG